MLQPDRPQETTPVVGTTRSTRVAGPSDAIIGGVTAGLDRTLRAWRDRLAPSDVGLPERAGGRAPGLRREDVAALAGISVNYLIRLEQGRATAPSPSVVQALVRALQLSTEESEHLHRLAGLASPTAGAIVRRVTPSVQRVLDRLADVPVIVIDPAWTIVAGNALAEAYLGGPVVGENSARRQFIGPAWVEHDLAETARYERDIVGDLHRQIALHPDDPAVSALIEELRAGSARFAALWDERPANLHASARKTVHHPVVGTITVDCDVLEVVGSDLRLVIWTAEPGTADGDALRRLTELETRTPGGTAPGTSPAGPTVADAAPAGPPAR
jgi:transcriptional regulator with XRE-family HTH domain